MNVLQKTVIAHSEKQLLLVVITTTAYNCMLAIVVVACFLLHLVQLDQSQFNDRSLGVTSNLQLIRLYYLDSS